MEQLFLEIQKLIAEGMPELLLVDEDYGQLTLGDEDIYPVVFPCVLIDIPQVNWSTLSDGYQQGNTNISIRLCIDCFDDTHYTSGTSPLIAERLAMLQKLHNLLQDFTPGNSDIGLERTMSRFYSLPGAIKVYENTYSFMIEDYEETD